METLEPEMLSKQNPRFINPDWIRKKAAEADEKSGFVLVPGATAEMAQRLTAASMRERGIDPDSLYYLQDDEDDAEN